jgi:hypothetical protein
MVPTQQVASDRDNGEKVAKGPTPHLPDPFIAAFACRGRLESQLGGARIMLPRRAAHKTLEYLLEVVAQEPSARLLDCHGLSDFASDALEPAFGVES